MSSAFVLGSTALARPGDRFVALDLAGHDAAGELGIPAVYLHELMGQVPPPGDRADEVRVAYPTWRGAGFGALLEWLVCARLGIPGRTSVRWLTSRRGGATVLHRLLVARGWELEERHDHRDIEYRGIAAEAGELPLPPAFTERLGGRELTFRSGWGVFSARRVDRGTRLLLDALVERGPVESLLDVGTGCGFLAVAALATGLARRAMASDVDSAAAALAGLNAAANGVPLRVDLEGDPSALPPTELTLCNFPTHAGGPQAGALLGRLCRRAARGPVWIVVHASLEPRFARAIERMGMRGEPLARDVHAVLAVVPAGDGLHRGRRGVRAARPA